MTSPNIKDFLAENDQLQQRFNDAIYEIDSGRLKAEQISEYLAQMNEITQQREILAGRLQSVVDSANRQNQEDALSYDQLAELLIIFQNRIEEDRLRLATIKNQRIDKSKENELTTYYKKYYNAWSKFAYDVFIYSLITGLLFMVYVYLYRYVGKENAENSPFVLGFGLLFMGVLAYFIFKLYLKSLDIRRRSKYVFDEYDWSDQNTTVEEGNGGSTSSGSGDGSGGSSGSGGSTGSTSTSAGEFLLFDSTTGSPGDTSNNYFILTPDILTQIQNEGGSIQCANGGVFNTNTLMCDAPPQDPEAFTTRSRLLNTNNEQYTPNMYADNYASYNIA